MTREVAVQLHILLATIASVALGVWVKDIAVGFLLGAAVANTLFAIKCSCDR